VRRTPEQLAALPELNGALADPDSKRKQDEFTPVYARNVGRSIKPEFFCCRWYLHPLGLLAIRQIPKRPTSLLAGRLEGWFLVPLPRIDL